jgi:hypothetical protein
VVNPPKPVVKPPKVVVPPKVTTAVPPTQKVVEPVKSEQKDEPKGNKVSNPFVSNPPIKKPTDVSKPTKPTLANRYSSIVDTNN